MLIWGGCSQKHAVLRRAFLGETTTSSEAYMKATRTHGDPHRLSAFFKKLLDGAVEPAVHFTTPAQRSPATNPLPSSGP